MVVNMMMVVMMVVMAVISKSRSGDAKKQGDNKKFTHI